MDKDNVCNACIHGHMEMRMARTARLTLAGTTFSENATCQSIKLVALKSNAMACSLFRNRCPCKHEPID